VIEYLGGKMTIHSKPSEGTELVIRLPVSLFLMNCIAFTIDDYIISVPTGMVLSADRDIPAKDGLYDLRAVMGIESDTKIWGHTLKVTCQNNRETGGADDHVLAFSVDTVIGNKRIMVMPAGEILSKTGLIAGVGIMDDGRLSVLLDIESLPQKQG
jgi:two-component system, chemotaxis family, sensor kinase CheA